MRCLTLALVAAVAAPAAVGCAAARAGEPLTSPDRQAVGDPAEIQAASAALDAALAEAGPASERVVAAADALLEARPEPAAAGRAHLLKAEAFFAQGDDAAAIEAAALGLEAVGLASAGSSRDPAGLGHGTQPGDAAIGDALERVWIQAMVRGGDPSPAVTSLLRLWRSAAAPQPGPAGADPAGAHTEGPSPGGQGAGSGPSPRLFTAPQWRALLAVAAHRRGRDEFALAALASWRATLAAGDPGLAWAETALLDTARAVRATRQRGSAAVLSPTTASTPTGKAAVPPMREGDAAEAGATWTGLEPTARHAVERCLELAGERPPPPGTAASPRWTAACAGSAPRVGVLLPRSGKLASIADAQLEGIEVGLTLLSATGEAPAVTWLDPGIGEAGIQRAGSAAIRDGIDTLIGPVGHDAVALAQDHLGGLTLVVPGEVAGRRPAADAAARAVTIPSAATLEARVAALSVTARAVGATRAIVLTPASSYGRRAASAAKLSLSESGFKSTEFIEYPATATSFSEFTDALRGADARVAILVFDAMPRVEAVLRQLRRDGIVGGARGALVASTGEGFDPARLTAARGVFEGVWLAPPAFASPEDAFARAFQTRFGRGPSDQAVLAWRALLWATGHPWTGAERATSSTAVGDVDGSAGLHPPMASAPALVGRVQGDRLVPQ